MISFPRKIQIETTILCNGACKFCPQNELTRRPKYMEERIWKKIIDESAGHGVIYRPFLVNEPFVDERLPEIISYIRRDNTAKIELNSNGHWTKKHLVEDVLNAGVDWIRFSVDGFSEETYKKSGRGTDYNAVVNNVRTFIEERNRLGSDCFVEVRMIDMDFNRYEHKGFIEYWSQYADKATVTQLYSWPWTGQTESHKAPCLKVVDEMFFIVDGRASLCCWDFMEKGIIGDINSNTVEEIWLGQMNQKYRQYLDKGERDRIDLCSRFDAYKNHDFTDWPGYENME